ncbi:MAG: serine--tRNA ligase, partial [Acidimicrobiia bacterium]|nr:serine--tRNA ligase [Acidimicrobiia bacterium]
MLDPRRLRTELDVLKQGLARRGADTSVLDTAAELDERHRQAVANRDDVRSRVNALSKEVGEAFKAGDKATGERKREESKALGEQEHQAEAEARELQEQLRDLLLRVPNIPADDCPDG